MLELRLEDIVGTFDHKPTVGVLRGLSKENQEYYVLREMQKQGFCTRRDVSGRFYSALSQSTYTDRLNRLRGV